MVEVTQFAVQAFTGKGYEIVSADVCVNGELPFPFTPSCWTAPA